MYIEVIKARNFDSYSNMASGYTKVYINFKHAFPQNQSDLTRTLHSDLVLEMYSHSANVVKNFQKIQLDDDFIQKIRDIILIEEL